MKNGEEYRKGVRRTKRSCRKGSGDRKKARKRKEEGKTEGIYDEARRRGRCNTWSRLMTRETRRLASHGVRARSRLRADGAARASADGIGRPGVWSRRAYELAVPYALPVWGRMAATERPGGQTKEEQ